MLILLSFLVTTANAKSLPSFSLTLSPTNDLSDRLAADKDFQDFALGVYNLVAKIQRTKTSTLFANYLNRTISTEEKIIFLEKTGYQTEQELISFFVNNNNHKTAFNTKFPALHKIDDSKIVLVEAFKIVVKNFFKPSHTDLECLAAFAASLNACYSGCYIYANDPFQCTLDCWTAISALYFMCILTAEL